jgi:hypothetical protein
MNVHDVRAKMRGFRNADHFLNLAESAMARPRQPVWVWREYRAIYQGQMWLKRGRR